MCTNTYDCKIELVCMNIEPYSCYLFPSYHINCINNNKCIDCDSIDDIYANFFITYMIDKWHKNM